MNGNNYAKWLQSTQIIIIRQSCKNCDRPFFNHLEINTYSVLSHSPKQTEDRKKKYRHRFSNHPTSTCSQSLTVHFVVNVSPELLYKWFYWQGDLDLRLKAWEQHMSLVWTLKSHFALLDAMRTQTLISKFKLAAEDKGALTVTPRPFHLPFCRNTSQFHLEPNSHKIWAPSSPRTTGQYVGRHSHRREAPVPQQPITIPSENSEFWGDGVLKGSWLSSKLLLHFYIKSQLECQMSFQPSPDTARQCAQRNKRGSERDCTGVTTEGKKGSKKWN